MPTSTGDIATVSSPASHHELQYSAVSTTEKLTLLVTLVLTPWPSPGYLNSQRTLLHLVM